MSGRKDGWGSLPRFAAAAAGVGLVGLLAALLLPREPEARQAAALGVVSVVLTGVLALVLKRRALARSLKVALAVVGVMFGVRLVLVAAGVVYVARAGLGVAAFTVGFFGVYFVLQWIEIGYVLVEAKRLGRGGVRCAG